MQLKWPGKGGHGAARLMPGASQSHSFPATSAFKMAVFSSLHDEQLHPRLSQHSPHVCTAPTHPGGCILTPLHSSVLPLISRLSSAPPRQGSPRRAASVALEDSRTNSTKAVLDNCGKRTAVIRVFVFCYEFFPNKAKDKRLLMAKQE